MIVDANGHYAVNGQSIASKDAADLNTAIKQISNERRDLMFVIAADAKATHQDVIRVMDVAGNLALSMSTSVRKYQLEVISEARFLRSIFAF